MNYIQATEQEIQRYKSLKTFDEYCEYGYLFATDKVKYSPIYGETYPDRKNLYENGDNIQHYIAMFNKHGYFTRCSQPSKSKILHSPTKELLESFVKNDRIPRYGPDHELHNKLKFDQRAAVTGFMINTIANKIYDKLKDDPRIIVLMADKNNRNIEGLLDISKQNDKKMIWFNRFNSNESQFIRFFGENNDKNIVENIVEIQFVDVEYGNSDEYVFKTLLNALQSK